MSDSYRIVYDGWYDWRCRVVPYRTGWAVELDRRFGSFDWDRWGHVRTRLGFLRFAERVDAITAANGYLDKIAGRFDGEPVA